MEPRHEIGEAIADRYRIASILGHGGSGITYAAEDRETGKRVALKELSLRRLTDWKALELFEREARVLSQLNHPGIPAYLDYFQVDEERDRSFYLVQEIAAGESLAALVESGWRASEGEVRLLAGQILEILSYLHGLTPPVIHRDIKPQNIIRRDDGRLFLVDFGAVQHTYRQTFARGSTVVGTYGYMAPEQFLGQAVPATDLYGLGATLLFVLARTSPADMPQHRLKIDFRSRLDISADLADWLEMMLEPMVEDRFATAKEAIAVLKGDREIVRPQAATLQQPAGSRVVLKKTTEYLTVEIPPAGLREDNVFLTVFALIWNAFIFFWTSSAIGSGAPLIFSLFSIPFWLVGASIVCGLLFRIAGRTRLEMNREYFRLRWALLGISCQIEGNTQKLDRVQLGQNSTENGESTVVALVEGRRVHRFGSALTLAEKEWLVAELYQVG